jgi:hypothetical protein
MGDLPAASGLLLLPALVTVSIVSGRLPGNSAAAAATAAALEGSFISSDTSAGGQGRAGGCNRVLRAKRKPQDRKLPNCQVVAFCQARQPCPAACTASPAT